MLIMDDSATPIFKNCDGQRSLKSSKTLKEKQEEVVAVAAAVVPFEVLLQRLLLLRDSQWPRQNWPFAVASVVVVVVVVVSIAVVEVVEKKASVREDQEMCSFDLPLTL